MRTEMIPLALIDDSDRIRPVDPAWAEVMAAGLAYGAELPAIMVRPAALAEVAEGCRYALVIGGHRLAAHRLAGRAEIRADVEEMTRAEARIREVDENLIRHELTALDRCVMLRERKLAWEEAYPETKHGGDAKYREKLKNSKSQTLRLGIGRFSADAAERVGLAERTVQADIALAEQLSPEAIRLIRATDLVDNAAELRRLAAHDPADQVRLARRLASGDARSVVQARVADGMDSPIERDIDEVLINKICDLLSRANAKARRRIKAHMVLIGMLTEVEADRG